MTTDELKASICGAMLFQQCGDSCSVHFGMYYGDGDGISVYVTPLPDGQYQLSDDGDMLWRVDVGNPLMPTRDKRFKQLMKWHDIQLDGEHVVQVITPLDEPGHTLGHGVFSFCQGLLDLERAAMNAFEAHYAQHPE